MSVKKPDAARKAFGHIAPKFAEITDEVLFGDVWERSELSPRDRSLITVPYHMKRALQNGVTKEELIETITHIAFYAGWPAANTAIATAQRVFDEVAKS
jgi:4-carboxymuconolactone decarboxylase